MTPLSPVRMSNLAMTNPAKTYLVPAGKYVFGDPCYFDNFDTMYEQMHKDLFSPDWKTKNPLAHQGVLTFPDGTSIWYLQACTELGDGGFPTRWPGESGCMVGVDSGTLALVALVEGKIEDDELEHTTVEFEVDTPVTIRGGNWYVGDVCVCTTD